MTKAFGVALFLMLMILLLQFNSFYSSFLILFAVVMSTAGVCIGLMVTSQPFGIVMSGVGVIALAGIVVNNNIILIDTFDFLRSKSSNIREAIIKTTPKPMRIFLEILLYMSRVKKYLTLSYMKTQEKGIIIKNSHSSTGR